MRERRSLRARLLVALAVPVACMTLTCRGSVSRAWSCGKPPPVPTPPSFPSCPSGEFCATVADIARGDRDREIDAAAHADGAPSLAHSDASIGPPPPPETAPLPYADCQMHAIDPHGTSIWAMTTFDLPSTTRERATHPTMCCYTWVQPCPGGRPLRSEGAALVASAVARDDWRAAIDDRETDGVAAERWLREAAFEHASIASFARASLQLLALGAPPELVSGAHAAALDEIEHARLCYALASSHAVALGPGALALETAIDASPSAVAVDTFVCGCVNETVAAVEAEAARDAARDPSTRAVLARIAEDEARHAALAWQTLAWLVRAHPSCVRALANAVAEIDQSLAIASLPRARVLRDVVLPCAQVLLGVTPRRAARRTKPTSPRTRSSTPET